jgi:hypothetical protein
VTFPTSEYLRKATSRAKSDVANKLVSMFLHGLSRKISTAFGQNVNDGAYADAVAAEFENNCCYCLRPLEKDRAAVEHLDAMNRFRLGLHLPGNVIVSCKRCNGEKRRDDQIGNLTLADGGWESFLSHDSTRCLQDCKTCAYWRAVWPDVAERVARMRMARQKIAAFRARDPNSLDWSERTKRQLQQTVDGLYRDCQEFATARINKSVAEAFAIVSKDSREHPQYPAAARANKS